MSKDNKAAAEEAAKKAAAEEAAAKAAEEAAKKAAAEEAAAKAAEESAKKADPEGAGRVEKSEETAIHTSPQADPEAKPKLYQTSDGEKFYQETHAIMHARTLKDSTVTPV